MRTVYEVCEDIKGVLNNIERTETCDGETVVDINEFVDEIIAIESSSIKQSISKCHLVHLYESPGIEEGMCAGLRTQDGEGEPCNECKECRMQYQYREMHD